MGVFLTRAESHLAGICVKLCVSLLNTCQQLPGLQNESHINFEQQIHEFWWHFPSFRQEEYTQRNFMSHPDTSNGPPVGRARMQNERAPRARCIHKPPSPNPLIDFRCMHTVQTSAAVCATPTAPFALRTAVPARAIGLVV